jgi:RND family efflux transporter MFP subunit
MQKKLRIGLVPAITAVLFAVMAAVSGCQEPTRAAAKSPVPVRLADVTLYSASDGLRYSASVLPFAQTSLAFKSPGYVTGIKQVVGADGRRRDIDTGDYVNRGTILAHIRYQDLKDQLDAAAAALKQAEAQQLDAAQDYQRAKALYATQSLTKPDFDQAQARFDSTRASVNQARANLQQAQLAFNDADLKAPFSGYVLARNIELGDLVAPGVQAFTIADTHAVKISFGVPDYTVTQMHLGQQFRIRLQDYPKEYQGRVTSIAASADPKDRIFAIEVTVSNPKSYLKPGMITSVTLEDVKDAPAPAVPLSAVVPDPASPAHYAVFVAMDQGGTWVAHLRGVTLGQTYESDVAVDGVKPGEKVVAVGADGLRDGDFIQVLP